MKTQFAFRRALVSMILLVGSIWVSTHSMGVSDLLRGTTVGILLGLMIVRLIKGTSSRSPCSSHRLFRK